MPQFDPTNFPMIMTPDGPVPLSPTVIRQKLLETVGASRPGYTANLPGVLVEDISSTEVAGITAAGQFFVDLVNSVTPMGANGFIINQLGAMLGVNPQLPSNTSVFLDFTGTSGFVVAQGFTVSDGAYQYVVQDGGIIGEDGHSLPLYALAVSPGTWDVPPDTVNQLITSVRPGVALAVTNPLAGLPSNSSETEFSYRQAVLAANLAGSTGMTRYLKTLLKNVPGVQMRLVSARADSITGRYVMIVGGGDPYQVAYAMYYAMFWVIGFVNDNISVVGIDPGMPTTITTGNNHNLITGDVELITGVNGTGAIVLINGQELPIVVTGPKSFTMPFDTSAGGSYYGGGVITPNPINEDVSIYDYPDRYVIPYVIPPQEVVTITVTWQTNSPNYVSAVSVAQMAGPALMNYINSIPAGNNPINTYDLNEIFLDAIAPVVPSQNITVLNFVVGVNGVGVSPIPGSGIIPGDMNSYFYTELDNIVILQSLQLPT
jgi:hypothetical protein